MPLRGRPIMPLSGQRSDPAAFEADVKARAPRHDLVDADTVKATNEELWGGTITHISLDPTGWALRVHIKVPRMDRTDEYLLSLTGIKQLTWTREVPLPWNYAELTEIHVEDEADGLMVDVVIWNEPTGFVARCEQISVDLQP